MWFRDHKQPLDPTGRLDDVIKHVPSSARQLVLACMYRDAVDRISLTRPSPTPFVHPRTAAVKTNSQLLFIRDPARPLFTRPLAEATTAFARMQALLEGLASAGFRPIADHDPDHHDEHRVVGNWISHELRLVSADKDLMMSVFALTSKVLASNVELAPALWRGGIQDHVYYSGARILLAGKHGVLDIELGEHPGSVGAILKALQTSEQRRGSTVDLYWPARHLATIPYVVTGPALFLIRGAVEASAQPLAAIDLMIRERDLPSVTEVVGGNPTIRLHPTDDETFDESQSLSTRHTTVYGGLNLGPVHDPVRIIDLTLGSHPITA